MQINRTPTSYTANNERIARTEVQYPGLLNDGQVHYQIVFQSSPEISSTTAKETVDYEILAHFFCRQAMQALQYLCRHSTEEQRIALRGQHRALQTRTSDVERQGREQPVNQQGSDFERSQRKLIFDLRHALYATGHVPGICIDFPLSFRPKEEYTRYTWPISPVTRRHRLAFLTVQVINNAIRKQRSIGEDQEASNPAHNPQYSTQICYKNYPSHQPNAHSLEAL